MTLLSPSRFLATEQCEGQKERDDTVLGFNNGFWAGVAIWAIAVAVVMGYSA